MDSTPDPSDFRRLFLNPNNPELFSGLNFSSLKRLRYFLLKTLSKVSGADLFFLFIKTNENIKPEKNSQ